MAKKRWKKRHAGRPHDPNAKRRTATTITQRSPTDFGTQQMQKIKALAGSCNVAVDFPLDVMLARGIITNDQYGAGCDFAALAWSLFGVPVAGCEALYERMIAGTPWAPPVTGDVEADEARAAERRKAMRTAHEERIQALRTAGGDNRRVLSAVQNATQYLRFPRYLVALIGGLNFRPTDLREIEDIKHGLSRLSEMKEGTRKKAA